MIFFHWFLKMICLYNKFKTLKAWRFNFKSIQVLTFFQFRLRGNQNKTNRFALKICFIFDFHFLKLTRKWLNWIKSERFCLHYEYWMINEWRATKIKSKAAIATSKNVACRVEIQLTPVNSWLVQRSWPETDRPGPFERVRLCTIRCHASSAESRRRQRSEKARSESLLDIWSRSDSVRWKRWSSMAPSWCRDCWTFGAAPWAEYSGLFWTCSAGPTS